MKLYFQNSLVYDAAKWTAAIFLPAAQVLWFTLASVWSWPYVEEVSASIASINLFIGALVGVSNAQYNKAEVSDQLG